MGQRTRFEDHRILFPVGYVITFTIVCIRLPYAHTRVKHMYKYRERTYNLLRTTTGVLRECTLRSNFAYTNLRGCSVSEFAYFRCCLTILDTPIAGKVLCAHAHVVSCT